MDITARLCHIPEHVPCLRSCQSRFIIGQEGSRGLAQDRVLLYSPTCSNVSTGPITGLASCYSKICGATYGHLSRFWIGWSAVIIGGLGMFYCLMRWRRNYVWGLREVISWVILSGVPSPKRHWKVIGPLDLEYMQRQQVWCPQSAISGELQVDIWRMRANLRCS